MYVIYLTGFTVQQWWLLHCYPIGSLCHWIGLKNVAYSKVSLFLLSDASFLRQNRKYARLAYLGRRETEGTPTVTATAQKQFRLFYAVRHHKSQYPALPPGRISARYVAPFQNGTRVLQTDDRQQRSIRPVHYTKGRSKNVHAKLRA